MRAVTIQDGRLVVAERPDPEPGSGELLVRVAAAGIDGGDLAQLEGHYPAPPGSPADVPGLELAGEVAGTGPFDVVLELVGAPNFPVDLKVLASGGRIVVVDAGRLRIRWRPPSRRRRPSRPTTASPPAASSARWCWSPAPVRRASVVG